MKEECAFSFELIAKNFIHVLTNDPKVDPED
jgi:hypothetical protein